ncbi:MAG: cell envelope integrity protein TolA [Alphaproteobacteria bacterium]
MRVAKRVPKPRAKPKPPPDRFQALLKNLAKQSKQQRKEEKRKDEPKKKTPAKVAAAPAPSAIDRRRDAASLAQMVDQQIRQCWNIPGGAKDVAEMTIEIRIRLNPDGALGGAPLVGDARRMQTDPVFRTVAESAIRALRDPRCAPLQLPYAHYDLWKDITLNFDPRKALGQ